MLETLRRDLVRRGLPHAYVERVVGELDDHGSDLRAEGTGGAPAAGRLGEAHELADAVTIQFRSRSFAGRHPVLTFVAAPIPVALAIWVVCAIVGGCVVEGLIYAFERHITASAYAWGSWAETKFLVLAPAIGTLVFSRLAYRCGRGWRWQCASSAILIVLACVLQSAMTVSPLPGKSMLMIGVGFPPGGLQALLPIAIAAAFLWRARRTGALAAA
jgi:hypothetical protein